MNCKPGDLAIVVGARYIPAIGHICEVLRRVAAGQMFYDPSDRLWDVIDNDCWLVRFQRPVALDSRLYLYAVWSDSRLRPIRDNPGNESFVTEARKSLPAPLERAKPAEVEA